MTLIIPGRQVELLENVLNTTVIKLNKVQTERQQEKEPVMEMCPLGMKGVVSP